MIYEIRIAKTHRPIGHYEGADPFEALAGRLRPHAAQAHRRATVCHCSSAPFCELAAMLVATLPPGAERTVALRKLLESKDAAVRARIEARP